MTALRLRPKSIGERVLDDLSTAILVLDGTLKLSFLNPAAEEMLALSARQAIGSGLQELIADDGGLFDFIQNAIDTGRSFVAGELHLRCISDTECTVNCSVTPISISGRQTGVLLELFPQDRQMRISREENLLAQHHAAHDLVRGLAHEIKNPLGGLRGAAQLLERELGDPELREYTSIIIGEADRLQALVDRMLGPNRPPSKRESNIHKVLEHVRKLITAEFGNGVFITRDYDPSVPDLLADPDMLIQAILNVVRNSMQAMNNEGSLVLRTRVERQLTIGVQRFKLALRLDVVDSGPGINPEILETIFYPMVTGREDGTGLGLSIAQSIVNRHGGLIECSSVPGETIFSIFLPIGNSK